MSSPSGGLTGNLVKGRWKVIRKIGQGAFGEIYSGRNVITSELVAIKVERVDSQKQVLKLEVAVVKKLQTCPYVVKFVSCGCHNEYNYMVMELLGDNISELRRRQPNVTGSFSMQTTLKLGLQMLRAIEAVHDLGFLHRDIKPSNFAMGLSPSKRHSCYMIDFGLSRRYLLPDGTVRPQREQTGFRGTARYASINSHLSKDLSRRDDLWSLFYLLIEFANGQLPWRRIKDKDKVGEMKLEMDNAELVAGLPHEFLLFMQHLQQLQYEDRPNYNFLRGLMTDLYTSIGGTDDTPFDWEVSTPHTPIVRPRPLPTLSDLCFVKVAINIQQYKQLRLPFSLKKRMLNLIIRTGNGNWPRTSAKQLVDENIQELDLSKCKLEEEDSQFLSKTCNQLRSLSLGLTDDNLLRLFLSTNTKLEQLSFTGSKFLSIPKGIKVIETLSNLHSLRITNHDRLTDKNLSTILKVCNKITELAVVNCKKVRGVFFKSFTAPKKIFLNLQNLDLSMCPLSKKAFKHLSKSCSSIQILKLSPLTTKAKFSSLDFTNVLHFCKNLQILHLGLDSEMDQILIEVSRFCHKLSGLILKGHDISDYGLQNVVHSCSSLDTLQFQISDGLTNATLYQIAKTCSSLKKLSIDFGKGERSSISVPAVNALLQSSTVLTELTLKRCCILSVECFRDGCFIGLKTLNLSHCVQLSDSAVRHIVETCPTLTSLSLNNLNNLTGNALESVSLCCPTLEELHIKQCPCFTDENIKSMLKFLPKLFIKLTRYFQGSSGDIVGTDIEVHSANVNELFDKYKNTAREQILSRIRVGQLKDGDHQYP